MRGTTTAPLLRIDNGSFPNVDIKKLGVELVDLGDVASKAHRGGMRDLPPPLGHLRDAILFANQELPELTRRMDVPGASASHSDNGNI
jgi:hypothetical protein